MSIGYYTWFVVTCCELSLKSFPFNLTIKIPCSGLSHLQFRVDHLYDFLFSFGETFSLLSRLMEYLATAQIKTSHQISLWHN
jgi:hypothetical protein